MNILIAIFYGVCVVAVGYMIYLLYCFAKSTDVAERRTTRRLLYATMGVMILLVASVSFIMAWEPVAAAASDGGVRVRHARYSLEQDSFEFRSSEFELVLLYSGEPVQGRITWHVVEMPDSVISARIDRVEARTLFSYTGLPPRTIHTFTVIATVSVSDIHDAHIPLTLQIYNSSARASMR